MNKFLNKTKELLSTENSFSAALTALVLAVVTVVNVLLYVLVSNYGLYLRTVEGSDLSLSGATDALFANVGDDEEVTVIFCQSKDEMEAHETGLFVHETALAFAQRYDFINVEYVNIITKRDSKGNRVDVDKFVTDKDGNVGSLYPTSVIFTNGTNHHVVTDYSTSAGYSDFFTLNSGMKITSYNGEETMAAMISRVISTEPQKTVYFTLYHDETADLAFYNLMICAGYNVAMIDLRTTEVPEDAAMLVISNPIHDFERAADGSGIRTELERIESYLEGGGRLYVALDPIAKPLPELEKTLSGYGITLETSKDGDGTAVRHIIRDEFSARTPDGFTLVVDFAGGTEFSDSVRGRIEGFGEKVLLEDAAVLRLDSAKGAEALLIASGNAEAYTGDTRVSAEGGYCVAATAPVYGEDAVGRVFVTSSVYLTAADALTMNGYSNKNFVFSVIEEMTGAEMLPYNCRAVLYDTETLQSLVMGTAKIYTAFIMAIPAVVAVVGAVVIIRRKNR